MSPESWLTALTVLLNSFLLCGILLTLTKLMKRASAAHRHLVLVSLFLALLVLPVTAFILPSWDLSLLPRPIRLEGSSEAQSVPLEEGENLVRVLDPDTGLVEVTSGKKGEPLPADNRTEDRMRKTSSAGPRTVWLWIGVVSWVVGVAFVLVVQLTRWAGVGFIAEMASPLESLEEDRPSAIDVRSGDSSTEISARLAREFSIPGHVHILGSGLAAVSMAWGIRNPYIILPGEARHWSVEKTEAVLRHEFAHIKRRDNLIHLLAILVCAIYWCNPLVWIALRRLHFEREAACDDAVINAGTPASTYAKHLMEVAMRMNGPKSSSIIPAVMAHSSNVKMRLLRVLNSQTNRKSLARGSAAAWIAVSLIIAVPFSMLTPWDGGDIAGTALADPSSSTGILSRTGGEYDLRFNGSDSHVVVPDSDRFDFQGDFTLEARINVADLSQNGQNLILVSKHRSHVHDGEWVWTILGPPNPVGKVEFTAWANEDTYTAATNTGAIHASAEHCGGWQVIALCYSASSHEWRYFIDGMEENSGIGVFHIGQTERDVWIGWESNEPHHNFNGWIKELRISDTVRYTSAYDHEAPLVDDSHTIAHWDFSAGSGTVLEDVSGNGHDGSIMNCDWDWCEGGEIEVEPGTNLQEVVDSAPDGAVIRLLPGTHYGPVVIAGRDLTICGCGPESTTLDANFYDYAVAVREGGDLIFCDLKVINCFNDNPQEYYYPAALTVDHGDLEVVHCLLQDNLNGIAAWRYNSLIHVAESTFLTDTAVAAITREAEPSTSISLENCTLAGNRTDHDHGLIKMWGGVFSVNQCVLSMPEGRAIEYHSGNWTGGCNIVHASVQASGGLVLPDDHWNLDPLLCEQASWEYRVYPDSPALPDNNSCGVLIGSGGSCTARVQDASWSQLKSLY